MEIAGDSLDEILIEAYKNIRIHGADNVGSRGSNKELIGVVIKIRHPRARLSRSEDRGRPFSAIGEFLWYMSGRDEVDFITAYIPGYAKEVGPDGSINGAYGPRIFSRYGLDQLEAVEQLLRRKPGSRRAVIQIYSGADLQTDEEVPCTTTLQFLLRDGKLHLVVCLRSNDAYLGLPHDVFCFIMLQEMMARRLECDIGEYTQMVGSFHLYDRDEAKVTRYLAEGHHRLSEMPTMPKGNPFNLVPRLLELEGLIRRKISVGAELAELDPYWSDLLRLVQVHFASDDDLRLDQISLDMQEPAYRTYLEDRRGRPAPR